MSLALSFKRLNGLFPASRQYREYSSSLYTSASSITHFQAHECTLAETQSSHLVGTI